MQHSPLSDAKGVTFEWENNNNNRGGKGCILFSLASLRNPHTDEAKQLRYQRNTVYRNKEIRFTKTKKYCLQKQKRMVKGVTFEWANNNNNQGAGLHFIQPDKPPHTDEAERVL